MNFLLQQSITFTRLKEPSQRAPKTSKTPGALPASSAAANSFNEVIHFLGYYRGSHPIRPCSLDLKTMDPLQAEEHLGLRFKDGD